MSLVGIGLAQELFVEFLYLRVVVRLTEGLSLVLAVKGVRSLFLVGVEDVVVLVREEAGADDRLTAAVYAAAGTTHDLDELVLGRTRSDLVEEHLRLFMPEAIATLTTVPLMSIAASRMPAS